MKKVLTALLAALILLALTAALAEEEEEAFVIDRKGTLTAYNGTDSYVEVPEGVTAIGEKAFYKNPYVSAVTLPEGVTSIGKRAFGYCEYLEVVNLPASLASIGEYAFAGSDELAWFNLQEGCEAFAVFSGALVDRVNGTLVSFPARSWRRDVVVPGFVHTVSPGAFFHCANLGSVWMGPSVTSIGINAFSGSSLEKIYLSSAMAEIGDYAFIHCDSLTQVLYDGSKKQWEQITVGKSNKCLKEAQLLYMRNKKTAEYVDQDAWLEMMHTNAVSGTLPRQSGLSDYSGRLIVAVYEQKDEQEPIALSLNEYPGFHGIPEDHLAESWDKADYLVLVYPEHVAVATYNGGAIGYRTDTKVQVVDLAKGRSYAAVTAASDEPPDTIWASDPAGWGEFLWEQAVEEIAWDLTDTGDESLYKQAQSLYSEEKYYSAQAAFRQSHFGDWRKRAAACVQNWPATGEIWRDPGTRGGNVRLTLRVNSRSDDTAMLARLYRDGKPVSFLFIAGSNEVSIRIPAGTYMIKDGTGRTWYGAKEAFGRAGSYETMLFDGGREEVYLQGGGNYTITVNVTNEGNVGSEDESFEGFAVD